MKVEYHMFALPATAGVTFCSLDTLGLGLAGEALIATILTFQGYLVQHVAQTTIKKGDLIVTDRRTGERYNIEVKTANKHYKQNRWQFHINCPHRKDSSYSDFHVLICNDIHDRKFLYLIPSGLLSDKVHIVITSHPTGYRGTWQCFRQHGLNLNFEDVYETANLIVGRYQ